MGDCGGNCDCGSGEPKESSCGPGRSSFAPVRFVSGKGGGAFGRAAGAPVLPAAERLAGGTIERKFIPPFKVFFTWDITYACNYRCTYCIVFESPQWDSVLSKKHRAPIPAEEWMRIWDDIHARYGSAHIHCSGGEPFYYPRFIDILAHITQKHTMECDTNLSFNVDEFIGRVAPGSFRFAPSYHPEYAEIDPYIEKCRKLKANGHDLEGVNFIAWPPHLGLVPSLKERFNEIGVVFTIIPFRGRCLGKDYPDAYTLEERRMLNKMSGNPILTEDYGSWYKGASQGGENSAHRAALCRAGQMYAKIHPNGNAIRCCFLDQQNRGQQGNLIDGTFALYEEPKICEFPVCACWKSMIVGEEERWLRHWVGVKWKGEGMRPSAMSRAANE